MAWTPGAEAALSRSHGGSARSRSWAATWRSVARAARAACAACAALAQRCPARAALTVLSWALAAGLVAKAAPAWTTGLAWTELVWAGPVWTAWTGPGRGRPGRGWS